MDLIHSIILGFVEGLTEFLPVSSTGHLILAGDLLRLANDDFLKSFEIVIQLGAILAVLFFYWKSFWKLPNLKKIIVGSIPTAVIGFGLYKIIRHNLLGSESVVLWALLLGGITLIIFEMIYKGPDVAEEKTSEITYPQAFSIGIFQCLAVIPGVSRSAATILGGLLLGIPRKTIVEFSFLLAVPTIAGASGLDIVKNPEIFSNGNIGILLVGLLVSFIVALITIKFFLSYIRRHDFKIFGVYRILLALLFFFVIF